MKYGNTSRTLSLIFHALIACAFGVLGLYYGIFVTPLWWTAINTAFTGDKVFAFNFNLELAAIGLTMFMISIYGFVQAVKSIIKPDDDDTIVKSFTAFIVEGYIGAVFAIANAAVYFDLLSFGSIPFIVVLGLLIAIVLLIAANIPMVRVFDGRDSKVLLTGLSYGGGLFLGLTALEILLAMVGIWARGDNLIAYNLQVSSVLGFSCLGLAIASVLAIVAGFIIKNKKDLSLAGVLDSVAVMLVGATIASNGIFDFYFRDAASVHLETADLSYSGLAYPVCAMVFGGLVIVAGVAFLVVTLKDKKKAAASPAR
ncbi:MAG: hypothetical protein LKK13_01655 [Bacilli bacterium]|jgi:hypothetical protein|nr:hypothetical protein [Bacilli bacterium]